MSRDVKVPSPTLLDRVVGYFNPAAGVERLKARTVMASASGYNAGRRDRRSLRNWRPKEASADTDIALDLPDLRARSRDLRRNMPIAAGAISTVTTSVVGDGLVLDAQIDREVLGLSEDQADAWEAAAEREFALAARTLDITGVQCFAELQATAFGAALESGDVFAVRRYALDPGDAYGTKLQLVEADRVSNPDRGANTGTLIEGIQLDKRGRPITYHVCDRHPFDMKPGGATWTAVPARDRFGQPRVLHLYDRKRPGQTRGVPYLAPVIDALKQLGDYSDAEVRAAVISAMFTVFVKTPDVDGSGPLAGQVGEMVSTDPDKEIALGSGAVVSLAPGEDIATADPGRPNEKFDPFVQAFLRQVGVALELPYELLIKHFTASYSASRAALEMAWQFFRVRRTWLVRRFCQPVYEWVITEAVASGRIDAPGFFEDPLIRHAWLGTQWIGPSRINLDPKKEAEADQIDIQNRVKTHEQVITERTGGRWDRKIAQLAKEQRDIEEAGLSSPAPAASPAQSQAAADNPTDPPDEEPEE